MDFDLQRLRSGEVIAGAGAVALLLVSFLDWYGVQLTTLRFGAIPLPTIATNAWDSFTVLDVLLAGAIAAGLGLVVLQATRRSPALPVTFSVISTVLAILTALAIVYRLLEPPAIDLPAGAAQFVLPYLSRTVEAGAYLGLVATLVLAAGSWLSMRQEGVAPRDEEQVTETISIGRRRS